jgi:hypothetical protein
MYFIEIEHLEKNNRVKKWKKNFNEEDKEKESGIGDTDNMFKRGR